MRFQKVTTEKIKKTCLLLLTIILTSVASLSFALDVPYFSQNDYRWDDDPMVSPDYVMTDYGCSTTCVAMVLNYYGVHGTEYTFSEYFNNDTNPKDLNLWLSQNKGYTRKNFIRWNKIAKSKYSDVAYSDVAEKGIVYKKKLSKSWKRGIEVSKVDTVKDEINSGHPVIVKVYAGGQHWVLIIAIQNGDYLIHDPLWPKKTNLSAYNNRIYATRIYHGTPPNQESFTARAWLGSSVIGNMIFTIGGGICTECGNFGQGETSTVEAYDTLANGWIAKSSLNIARFGLTTSVVDGKIYAIGGTNGSSSQPVSYIEEYSPSSDNWLLLEITMPTPRWKLTSAVVDGLIYTIGGGSTGNQCVPTTIVEEYDPVNDMWATKSPMPTARWGAASVVINDQIYVVGGSSACPHIIVDPSSALESYDPSMDTWTIHSPMPTPRWDLAAAVVNGKIYALGGWDPYSETVLQTVEEYDPVNDTWTTRSLMPTARTGLVVAVINGEIYTFGGFDGSQVTDIVEVYDPATDNWSVITP